MCMLGAFLILLLLFPLLIFYSSNRRSRSPFSSFLFLTKADAEDVPSNAVPLFLPSLGTELSMPPGGWKQ